MDPLLAITPIDGRYREIVEDLQRYFSEYAQMKYRIMVEIEYLRFLHELGVIKDVGTIDDKLTSIFSGFSLEDAREIKRIEKQTIHDVESVVRFLRFRLEGLGLGKLIPYIHLGLTSEDVTNVAYALAIRDFNKDFLVPRLKSLISTLAEIVYSERSAVMLGRTHSQPAVPTTLGKELAVHTYRLLRLLERVEGAAFPAKVSGAVGSYAALVEVLGVDADSKLASFLRRLGLEPWLYTKQVIPHDQLSSYLQDLVAICMVLLDLARDLWLLCLLGYVRRRKLGVGSSTMPHKVNPIEIENAEGNLEVAASMLNLLAGRLMVSRLQRDLSDSTIRRNYGSAMAYLVIAMTNLERFMKRIYFDREKMIIDLQQHPESISELVQVRLRLRGIDALDALRSIEASGSEYLLKLEDLLKGLGAEPEGVLPNNPAEYTGLCASLAERVYRLCRERLG